MADGDAQTAAAVRGSVHTREGQSLATSLDMKLRGKPLELVLVFTLHVVDWPQEGDTREPRNCNVAEARNPGRSSGDLTLGETTFPLRNPWLGTA